MNRPPPLGGGLFTQRAIGYSLTGSTREQCFFILHGTGANGKSTLLDVIQSLLGPDYARQAAPELLLAKQHLQHPTELADLRGARLVSSVETGEGRHLAENLVKQMTGGDRIKARRMRENFWEYLPEFKLWLATNHARPQPVQPAAAAAGSVGRLQLVLGPTVAGPAVCL